MYSPRLDFRLLLQLVSHLKASPLSLLGSKAVNQSAVTIELVVAALPHFLQ